LGQWDKSRQSINGYTQFVCQSLDIAAHINRENNITQSAQIKTVDRIIEK
jgi:hypothetical protein